jgi:hypothetical protein
MLYIGHYAAISGVKTEFFEELVGKFASELLLRRSSQTMQMIQTMPYLICAEDVRAAMGALRL